jgi:deoxyribodipyrimidine photo-lyase
MLSLVILQRDLRLQDNPALLAAVKRGLPVLIVYIYSEEKVIGAASKWWLHHSLHSLSLDLAEKGSFLCIQRGDRLKTMTSLLLSHPISKVYWNHVREPESEIQERQLKKILDDAGCKYESFESNYLFPYLQTSQQTPYQVFTPFWKACLKEGNPRIPFAAPKQIPSLKKPVSSCSLKELELLPSISWDSEFLMHWAPGEKGAHRAFSSFKRKTAADYDGARDFPGIPGTSKLSAHLHFGEISPYQIWHGMKGSSLHSDGYLRQLVWREFAASLLHFFPNTPHKALHPKWDHFPWSKNSSFLKKWQKGLTGYPIVDAGMRELLRTGWMHNRVRMIVGSFLVKDLQIDWREGAKWFWDTLVDADLANNTLGWQWVAGCGADAAPYFRIFNPVLQAKKFDPEGVYIRKYLPELQKLSNRWIHAPWLAPKQALEEASVVLGKNYPEPMVDHSFQREEALKKYKEFQKNAI